jgi:hypothetical protein
MKLRIAAWEVKYYLDSKVVHFVHIYISAFNLLYQVYICICI